MPRGGRRPADAIDAPIRTANTDFADFTDLHRRTTTAVSVESVESEESVSAVLIPEGLARWHAPGRSAWRAQRGVRGHLRQILSPAGPYVEPDRPLSAIPAWGAKSSSPGASPGEAKTGCIRCKTPGYLLTVRAVAAVASLSFPVSRERAARHPGSRSQPPGHRSSGIRQVRAVGTGTDGAAKVLAKRGMVLADSYHGLPDGSGNACPRTLRG